VTVEASKEREEKVRPSGTVPRKPRKRVNKRQQPINGGGLSLKKPNGGCSSKKFSRGGEYGLAKPAKSRLKPGQSRLGQCFEKHSQRRETLVEGETQCEAKLSR